MLVSFAIWLQNTELFSFLRYAPYGYLVILTLHVVCITLFGATILVTDLRLLGWGLLDHKIADVIGRLRLLKRVGLLSVVTCGILLYGSKAEEYYYNPFFRAKMILLFLVALHAGIFWQSVYRRAAEIDASPALPGRAKIAAGLSLVLWLAIACAGRAIGYISPASSPHHYARSDGLPLNIKVHPER